MAASTSAELVESVDLVPILEEIKELLLCLFGGQLILVGALIGVAVILVLAVMWR